MLMFSLGACRLAPAEAKPVSTHGIQTCLRIVPSAETPVDYRGLPIQFGRGGDDRLRHRLLCRDFIRRLGVAVKAYLNVIKAVLFQMRFQLRHRLLRVEVGDQPEIHFGAGFVGDNRLAPRPGIPADNPGDVGRWLVGTRLNQSRGWLMAANPPCCAMELAQIISA